MSGVLLGSITLRQYKSQGCEAGREIHTFVHVLLQKLLHARPECDGVIDPRIAAALIGADGNEIAVVLIRGERLAELPGGLDLLRSDDFMHRAAHRGFHVDSRVVTAFRDAARQYDMSVENGARGI